VVEAGPIGPPRSWPRRRQTIGVLVALVVLAALAAGGVVASSSGEPDAEVYGYGGHLALTEAITEKPDRDWTWEVSGSLTGLAAAGDTTYAATDDGEVIALDEDGHEVWTVVETGAGFLVPPPDHDELVIFGNASESTVTALSSDDGTVLWSADGEIQWFDDDRAYVATGEELVAYDLGSGDQMWSANADTIGVGEAGIFVLVGDELRRVDTDGRTAWSVEIVRTSDETAQIAVADDFVAVGGPRALAFDADEGDPLWSSDGSDGVAVHLFSRDEVALEDVAGAGDPMPIYDRDGTTGSIETSAPVLLVPLRSGSDEYTYSLASGELYGDGHEVVETYDGRAALAAEGLYLLSHRRISYFEYGAADPEWTLDDDLSDDVKVQTGDGRLLVANQGQLTSYS
jgi:outer membrane protein assembly factor BamB